MTKAEFLTNLINGSKLVKVSDFNNTVYGMVNFKGETIEVFTRAQYMAKYSVLKDLNNIRNSMQYFGGKSRSEWYITTVHGE